MRPRAAQNAGSPFLEKVCDSLGCPYVGGFWMPVRWRVETDRAQGGRGDGWQRCRRRRRVGPALMRCFLDSSLLPGAAAQGGERTTPARWRAAAAPRFSQASSPAASPLQRGPEPPAPLPERRGVLPPPRPREAREENAGNAPRPGHVDLRVAAFRNTHTNFTLRQPRRPRRASRAHQNHPAAPRATARRPRTATA